METNLKKIHQLIAKEDFVAAQDIFRKMISPLPANNVLSQAYILKAYELNTTTENPFWGLTTNQIQAHCLIVRQLLIENSEEFDRRISRVSLS